MAMLMIKLITIVVGEGGEHTSIIRNLKKYKMRERLLQRAMKKIKQQFKI